MYPTSPWMGTVSALRRRSRSWGFRGGSTTLGTRNHCALRQILGRHAEHEGSGRLGAIQRDNELAVVRLVVGHEEDDPLIPRLGGQHPLQAGDVLLRGGHGLGVDLDVA